MPHRRIAAERADDATDPAPEHRLKLLRVKRAQDAQEGLLGRDAVLEHKKAAQPRFFLSPPEGNFLDGVAVR